MIEKISNNNLTWVNIQNPTQEDLNFLARTYKFHDLDLEDCRSKVQRPKFENYNKYKFIVFHFPVMQKKGYRLAIEEADIFWGKDYIITIHSKNLSKIDTLFNSLSKNKEKFKKYFSKSSDYLLYNILHEMMLTIFTLMTQISQEIDFLDTNFDKIKASKMIERISALRRNIIFLQTSLKPQKGIFSIFETQLVNQENTKMDVYWGDIGDYIGKLLDMAEDYQELIEGLYSSIDTLLTYRMNNIMKTLTLFSVIMLPLTFITGFYGMNIKLPLGNFFSESLAGVGVVSGIMGIIAITMIIYFKIRKF